MADDAAKAAKAARRKEKHEYSVYQLSDTDPSKTQLVKHLENKDRRSSLALSGLSIRGKERGLSILFNYSRSHPILRLDLSNNSIQAIGTKRLAKGLRTNTSMTDLNLSENKLKPRDKKQLATALFSNSKSNLKYFACNEWSIKPEDTELKLANRSLGAHDFILIAGLLSKNPNIQTVDLSQNFGACGDYQGSGQHDESIEGINALCGALLLPTSARITKLNLSDNNIKSVGCDLVAQLLEGSHDLVELDLSCNQLLMNGPASIEIVSFEKFCEALQNSKTLRSLNLSETSLCAYRDHWRILHSERRAVAALCAAIETSSLSKLDVSRNYMGHEDVVQLKAICTEKRTDLECGNQRVSTHKMLTPMKNQKLAPLDSRPLTAPVMGGGVANKKKRLVQSSSKAPQS